MMLSEDFCYCMIFFSMCVFSGIKVEGGFLLLNAKLAFCGLDNVVCVWIDSIHFSKKALHLACSLIGR